MEITFNDSKLLFYTELRNDNKVNSLDAETLIRNLVEDMVTYIDHFNTANYVFQTEKTKKLNGHLESMNSTIEPLANDNLNRILSEIDVLIKKVQAEKKKPLSLDFADIKSIAYTVGTYQEDRSWLKRISTDINPLDSLVKEHEEYYKKLQRKGDLETRYFDENTITSISIAVNSLYSMSTRQIALDEMFKKSCDYINRQGVLLELADKEYTIHSYYSDENMDKLKRGFKEHDWSWRTANWKEDRLSKKDTKRIAGYFRRQAEINGILFKVLNYSCLFLRGESDAIEKTEKLYQSFMDSYKKGDGINAQIIYT